MDSSIELSTVYNKAHLFEEFKSLCPAHKWLSSISFKKWIDQWSNVRGYIATHYKSDGNANLRVEKKN
jgi:hypothetical protein